MVRQMIVKPVFALVALACFLVPSVYADTFVCENGFFVLGAGDVVEDVLILDGGILLMDGATVTGDIEIEQGGVLAASRSVIEGKVQAECAFLIDLTLCDIGEKVQLERTGGSGDLFGLLPSINVQACRILGNLKVTHSRVNSIRIRDNTIRGKLQLSRNSSTLPIVVENNTIIRR